MRAATIQIQSRGSVTLPARLRSKYRLGVGDNVTVIDLDGGILLTPRIPVVPKLAAEIQRLRRAAGLEVADLLGSSRPARRTQRGGRSRRG